MASASQIPFRNLGRQSWSPRPTGAMLVVRSSGPMWASAPTDRRGSRIDHPGQRRTAERLRRGREGWVEIGAWIIPKGASNAGQSLSHGEAVTAPFTQGSLGDGGIRLFFVRKRRGEVTPPYGSSAGGTKQRADVGIGPYALRGTARRGRRALRMVAESHRDCPGQRRTAERLRRGWEEGVEIEAGIIPEGGINVGQSLSHGEAVTAPFTQGSLWGRGMRIAASARRASSQ